MYYFAIFVALLSTFLNSSAQLQYDKTRAALERTTSPCETRCKDQNGSQQSKSSDYTEELSDAILHERALKKALSVGSNDERSKIRYKQQNRDSDASAEIKDGVQQTRSESDGKLLDKSAASQKRLTDKIEEESNKIPSRQQHRDNKSDDSNKKVNNGVENAVENVTNVTKKTNRESNDIRKNSKKIAQSEELIPVARLFEDLESSENVNSNKNVNSNRMSRIRERPQYRSFSGVEPSGDVKYDPPPYVKNRMNAFDNGNDNMNINSNRNKMSMKNETRNQNSKRERVKGNEDLTDGIETKLLSKPIESTTKSGIEDSIKMKDIQEVKKALSTRDSLEVLALSSTPSVKLINSIPSNSGSRIKRRRKHRRGKDRSRGNRKKHEQKYQRDQRPVSPESSASLGLQALEVFRKEIMINRNLTDAILKLLIDTREISALKKQRLKRLLDQLNVNEKRTILYDLEKELKGTLDENTTVKRVVISKAEPKIIVGLLARPSQGFQSPDTSDVKIIKLLTKKLKTPRNSNDTERNIDEISKKAIREKSDRSQELTDSSSTKLMTGSKANTKETVKNIAEVEEKTSTDRHKSDKVISMLDDPKVKEIFGEPLDEPRKHKSPKKSDVNLDANNNQSQLSDQTHQRLNISRVVLLLDRPVPHPRPGLNPQLDATKLIDVNSIPSDEDKEFKARARNHGRYNGILNEDDNEGIKKAAESHRPETIRDPKQINKRPLSPPMDSESVSQDKKLNVKSKLNDNDIKSDLEFTRRAARGRLPRRSNRKRNRISNGHVNVDAIVNIQAPASKDYYVDGEVWSSRRALDREISFDENSNSNSNVNSNSNDNQNVVDRLVNRKVPQREFRKDEVKISQETIDSILREVSQLRKQLAEKEAATNLNRERLWQNVDRKSSFDQSPNERVFLEY